MKLYYSPGSCSTSCHISLEEAGLKYEAIAVDFDNASDPNIALTHKLNSMGTLPVAQLDGNRVLTQNLAIHTYVADLAAEKGLLPKMGTVERAEAMDWLSFVATDLHKAFSPLFAVKGYSTDAKAQEHFRGWALGNLKTCLETLNTHLGINNKEYIMGKQFTVVDSYAFVVTGWTQWVDVSLAPYPHIEGYMKRVAARPAVQRVLKAEGLI